MTEAKRRVLGWLREHDVAPPVLRRVAGLLEADVPEARMRQVTFSPSIRVRLLDAAPGDALSLYDLVRAARAGRLGDVELPA